MSAISSLTVIQLPTSGRLLPSSWCPDKDLLVIATRLGGKDRLSLWKMQGQKKWEIGFDFDDSDSAASKDDLVDVAWSPDGQMIAVAHDPPRVTIHSIQNGHQERSLPISSGTPARKASRLVRIWWFMEEKKKVHSSIPDIFKRGDCITGSAHSILKGQPLLDPLQDDTQPLTSADLFAFKGKGTQTRSPASSTPQVISTWPTLPPDPLTASIQSSRLGGQHPRPGEDLDEVDDTNVNSVLVASDETGNLHSFMDGSYPLGAVSLSVEASTLSLYKAKDLLFAHLQSQMPKCTSLRPMIMRLPLLQQRLLRDVAKTSSSVRELAWYAMRVVKDMRAVWFGTDVITGARELGPKWIRALETRQKEEFGHEPYAMVDLTRLLTTGRITESLSDYLGSGEQMSERGLQKWETTMLDALVKLRDYSEKRLAPACQRLHVLLEEVHGWSLLPQYEYFRIDTSQVKACSDLASRAIVVSSWLSATSRRELARFKEFILWLKYETTRVNTSPDAHNQPTPKHDILEVNSYLMSGLVVSVIDKWFMGPVPQFASHDLGAPKEDQDLKSVMQRARIALKDRQQTAWQSDVKQRDLSHLDRNLDSLIQEFTTRCQRIFVEAANATARSAVLAVGEHSAQTEHGADDTLPVLVRERTVREENEAGTFAQYLAIQTPHVAGRSCVLLVRLQHGPQTQTASMHASVAVLECSIAGGDEDVPFNLCNMDFFDDSLLILVYRLGDGRGVASIATVGYSDLAYEDIEVRDRVGELSRESLMLEIIRRLNDGQLSSVPAAIVQSRNLVIGQEGEVSLSVNGRVGRRVASVLGGDGLAVEVLDMEGEDEEASGSGSMSAEDV